MFRGEVAQQVLRSAARMLDGRVGPQLSARPFQRKRSAALTRTADDVHLVGENGMLIDSVGLGFRSPEEMGLRVLSTTCRRWHRGGSPIVDAVRRHAARLHTRVRVVARERVTVPLGDSQAVVVELRVHARAATLFASGASWRCSRHLHGGPSTIPRLFVRLDLQAIHQLVEPAEQIHHSHQL